jgi:hypothetical protein
MIFARKREKIVDGAVYAVPTNVSRLDATGWVGWQVRFKGAPHLNKNFSDKDFRSTRTAFTAACKYATDHRPAPRSQCRVDADAGIRMYEKKSGGAVEVYVEVSAIQPGDSPRRLYVGTSNTVTEARIKAKWAEARGIRKQLVDARAKAVRAQ